jgi:hypothetical protein
LDIKKKSHQEISDTVKTHPVSNIILSSESNGVHVAPLKYFILKEKREAQRIIEYQLAWRRKNGKLLPKM